MSKDNHAKYPDYPGSTDNETSADAADSMAEEAIAIRLGVLDLLERNPGLTADEAAEKLDRGILSVRPRFSELRRLGLIYDTGVRRPNRSGRMAKVWALGKQTHYYQQ